MDFDYTQEERAFRTEVRAFVDAHLPPPDKRDGNFLATWLKEVRQRRWVGFSWPREFGGGGGSLMEQLILKQEMASVDAPPLGTSHMGLAWVGPAIIRYGTKSQQERFLPDILDSKVLWCTGYSEPDAGSDLAGIKTRARLDGDHYVVEGQKTWTSLAPWADWMILLARTAAATGNKHEGISCFLVPLDLDGITIRPIENTVGDKHFAEVFLDGVRVPVSNRLGEEGKGWGVTVSALANERSSIGEVTQLEKRLASFRRLFAQAQRDGVPALSDPSILHRMGEFEARIAAMKYNGLRYLTKQLSGVQVSSESSVNKLIRSDLEISMLEFVVEYFGMAGLELRGGANAVDKGKWIRLALSFPSVLTGGGTANIQRNIIAERILGLPRDLD
jgi:alkylation response protein AidB-like acyl-CoA dehydrogenase